MWEAYGVATNFYVGAGCSVKTPMGSLVAPERLNVVVNQPFDDGCVQLVFWYCGGLTGYHLHKAPPHLHGDEVSQPLCYL